MNLQYAKNPRWVNAEHTMIDLKIKWDQIDAELPFTASPTDCEAHGRAIFEAAIAGQFGPVAEYVPPPAPTTEEIAAAVRAERNRLLAATDWTQAADVPQATKDKWSPYRQALRDVPAQSGFPASIVWPAKPA